MGQFSSLLLGNYLLQLQETEINSTSSRSEVSQKVLESELNYSLITYQWELQLVFSGNKQYIREKSMKELYKVKHWGNPIA